MFTAEEFTEPVMSVGFAAFRAVSLRLTVRILFITRLCLHLQEITT